MIKLPLSIISAYRILKRFQPDVVFSKGSFVALPVGLAAKLNGMPIITHDSDSLPGLANRIIGRWAKVHATGLPAEFYSYKKSSVVQVGIPVDERIKKITPKLQSSLKNKLKLPKDSKVLLVTGGGNGSKRLNDLILAIAAELLETNLSLHIIHLTGQAHETTVKQTYSSLPKLDQKRIMTIGYSNEFYLLGGVADLVVTRAGATTLAGLAIAGKACIVIPAPFLTGGHQLKNAELLAKSDAAVVMPDETNPDELLATINSLLDNDTRRFELARNLYATAIPDASARLAQLILRVGSNNKK
jgi:UDP-N-acetylglucosamine--N-acetylmuramyl-(pentapeptide) pyrophosphoryl-undecaprenol N-acetylglucosamine transferase